MWLWRRLWDGGTIELAVQEPIDWKTLSRSDATCIRTVRVIGEKLSYRQHEALMLFTEDEEDALRLQADFLPGQRNELQEQKREAFAAGFVSALQTFKE
jgi:hypothetical protein